MKRYGRRVGTKFARKGGATPVLGMESTGEVRLLMADIKEERSWSMCGNNLSVESRETEQPDGPQVGRGRYEVGHHAKL